MKAIYCGATLLFIAMVGRHLLHYGQTWEFSPHGIPVSATSPDGKTYRNGDSIDPINAGLIRSGSEEGAMGCMIGVLFAVVAWNVYSLWSYGVALERRAQRMTSKRIAESDGPA